MAGDSHTTCHKDRVQRGKEGVKATKMVLPELPFPIVLPIFHRPITLGSSSFLSFGARRGVSCIENVELTEESINKQ
jgi:hypothetical protein